MSLASQSQSQMLQQSTMSAAASQSMDTFLSAFKSPSLQQYKPLKLDSTYSSLVQPSRRREELRRVRSRAVQMQQDELKQQRRHVHEGASSINTTGIEKAQVSRRKPRMARPGLRSGLNIHVEAVEAPTETRHRILQHAAE